MRSAVRWTVERLGRLKQRVVVLAAQAAELPVTVAARIHAAAAFAVRRPTRAATPARRWARRGAWTLAGAAAMVAAAASEAAANHDLPTYNPHDSRTDQRRPDSWLPVAGRDEGLLQEPPGSAADVALDRCLLHLVALVRRRDHRAGASKPP